MFISYIPLKSFYRIHPDPTMTFTISVIVLPLHIHIKICIKYCIF